MKRRVLRFAAALAILGATVAPLAAAGQESDSHPYSWGLAFPRSLAIDQNGHLLVAVQGSGNADSAVLRLRDLDGDGMASNGAEIRPVLNNLPSNALVSPEDPEAREILGASGLAVSADGEIYVVTGQSLLDPEHDKQFNAVWSTAAENTSGNQFRVANPYASIGRAEWQMNPDGGALDTNGYALVVDADGIAYVNDAGANTTWKVSPDGSVVPYAVYPAFPNPIDFGPPVVDMVPTGIAIGPDGALYVTFLTGFPFLEGASVVYRLEDLDGDGDALEAGEMEVYAEGLTTATALAFDADGNLYATEFRGFLTGQDMASGRVVMWDGAEWHVVADGLVSPTGLAIGWDNTVYVSQEFIGVVSAIHPGE